MRATIIAAIVLLIIIGWACPPKNLVHRWSFPSYSQNFPVPIKHGKLFALAQEYPDTFDVNEYHPWTSIDFKTDYKGYMNTILRYCLDGNVDVDFRVQDNKVRKWYNAPWLHYGLNGREYHHGLTRERPVPIHELTPKQNVGLENWAIGFYNAPGGYTIGKVWYTDSGIPNRDFADFPEGTVSFKLLFTAGTSKEVPFLRGSKEWTANIYDCNPEAGDSISRAVCSSKRIDSTVRLLQIDIAIKDKRAGKTGWVFGTFIYDGGSSGKTIWERMIPVGLMWGDDQKIDTMIHKPNAFNNSYLKETVLNQSLIRSCNDSLEAGAYMRHHGLGGRLNGPVDNPISSCISCHSKAAINDTGLAAPMADFSLTRETFTIPAFKRYFSTISSGTAIYQPDTIPYRQLDYSLQLSAGIRNYYQSQKDFRKEQILAFKETGFNPNHYRSKVKSARFRAYQQITKFPPTASGDLPEVTRNGLITP